MAVRKSEIIFCLSSVLVLLDCVVGDCPSPYLRHHHGNKTICCLPAYNCGPDAEILHCTEDMGHDTCESCRVGDINPQIVSSVDKIQHRCFKKQSHHESCPLEDTVPTVNVSSSKSCLLYCTCRTTDCYYGDEPCSCEGPQTLCKQNETLDPESGVCVPCPENSYKLEPGCGPCTWNVTALLGDTSKYTEKAPSTEKSTSSISGLVIVVPDGPAYNISQPDNETDTHTDTGGKGDGFSPAPVIAIVVLLLIVAILAAIVLVTYRKLQSNDDHSKLVKCFHALCPGRHYQAQAGQRDTESVTDPPYHPVQQNSEKPLQHVTPITRMNGTHHHESPDAYNDCSTIPFADMSMSPGARPPSLGRSLEEINEEEEQESSSAEPLIEDTQDSTPHSVDPELTEQKTAA